MLPYPQPWRDAWGKAAYGEGGFWRTERPVDHFRTSAATGSELAKMITALLDEHPEVGAVVDLGAGDGQLLSELHRLRPELDLFGVDLRDRPLTLPDAVTWCHDLWDVDRTAWTTGESFVVLETLSRPTLIISTEWLDDLPCTIASRGPDGVLRTVLVDHEGHESIGAEVSAAESEWAARWWPTGERVEIGISRDAAWRTAVATLGTYGGLALLIDYGHVRDARPGAGTLAGFSDGRQTEPEPSERMNLTAHVALDAIAAAGESASARTEALISQAEAVERWASSPDSTQTLAGLASRSHQQALKETFGGHWWLIQSVAATQVLRS